MEKKIIFISTLEFSERMKEHQIRILQSRTVNDDILVKFDTLAEESMESYPIGEQQNDIVWKSPLLPRFPKVDEGKVAEIYICDEFTQTEEINQDITLHLVQISYFDSKFPKEGLSDDMDFFYFIGYDRKIVEIRAEELAKYWNLKRV